MQAHLSTASAMEVQLYFQLRFPFAAYMRDAEANRAGYGPPPRLARRYLGNLLAEGYSERAISVANDVLDSGNTALPDGDIDGLVTLRMDRGFMSQYAGGAAAPLPPPPPAKAD